MRRPFLVALVALVVSGGADAGGPIPVCYRLPFSNPNLADGWGSTCCGRTNPHRGVDFPKPQGTQIPVVADGVVVVRTSTGCLGNVVVVRHADGMYSGYSHLQAQSPLAVGTAVTQGQLIARVGSTGTCTTGPHLHLTLSPHEDGYAVGGLDRTVDPVAYIADHRTCDRPPSGALADVSCDGVSGQASDPDTPTTPVLVQISFGPSAAAGAVDASEPVVLDVVTDESGRFAIDVPPALHDDVERPVSGAIVGGDGSTVALTGAPSSLRCGPRALPVHAPESVRRRVGPAGADADAVLAALAPWGQGLLDVAPGAGAALDALAEGAALPPRPALVTIDGAIDGGVDVFVDEATVLRPIDEETLQAWRLDGAGVSSLDAAAAAGRLVGAPWPPPALARDDDGAVFVIDAPPPLWADVSLDDRPVSLSSGERVTLVLRAKNRGSLAWHDDVVIVPTADGARFCDDSWQDCGAIATLPGDTAPGDVTSVAFTLQAPVVDKPTAWSLCVGLRLGAHAFGDAGMSGPDDDDVCAVVTVVPAAAAGGPEDDGGGSSTPAVTGGCGCMQGDVGVDAAFAWCLALVAVRRRRRR